MESRSKQNASSQENYIDGAGTPQSTTHESRFSSTNSITSARKTEKSQRKSSKSKRKQDKSI